MPDPKSDLALLTDAALAAGVIAKRFFEGAPQIWDKGGDAGPVTEADLAIDRMLHADLMAARPGYGWLSEETEDNPDRLERDHVFIVDPIDGTRAFIAGERSFSHSLALARNGEVVAGVVHVPMLDLTFSARIGQPATLNGAPITVSDAGLEGATVLAQKSNFDDSHWIGGAPGIVRKFRPSLAYRLCLIAQGRYDAMLTLRDCWEWDIAAGALIVAQAGGVATERAGSPLRFNRPHPKTAGCVAAGARLHEGLLARLRPLP